MNGNFPNSHFSPMREKAERFGFGWSNSFFKGYPQLPPQETNRKKYKQSSQTRNGCSFSQWNQIQWYGQMDQWTKEHHDHYITSAFIAMGIKNVFVLFFELPLYIKTISESVLLSIVYLIFDCKNCWRNGIKFYLYNRWC